MSDVQESASHSPADRADSRKTARQIFTLLYAVAMVLAAAGLAFVWLMWDPTWGPAVQNLATYLIVIASAVMTAGWLLIFSPFRWRTVFAMFGVSALLVTGAIASVRTFEFDGDMGFVLHYRWEPTAEERLTAHRNTASKAVLSADSLLVPVMTPEDSPGYRGVDRSGLMTGPALSQDWESSPPRQLWLQPCGGGYSSFTVVGDFVVTLEQRGENETVICYDGQTGAERWIHEYPASFYETVGGPGPRATPTVIDGEVYSFGAEGDLVCLSLADGDLRWHVDALPESANNVTWGLSSSPLIVDNLVIVEAGGPQGDGLIAYDRTTGDVVWQRPGVDALLTSVEENRAGYSSPVLATLHGVRQVVIFDGEGARGHVPETGEQLWFHEFKNDPGVNVAQPMFLDGGRIFLAQSYGVGCCMIEVAHGSGKWTTNKLWKNINMKCKFTSPVLHDGYLYGLDEGILVCLDPETGKRKWKKGRYGNGQILLINGQILVISERGDVVLVEAAPEKFKEVTRFSALDQPKVWNPHALANGIVYVRNHEEMAAYDLTGGD